MAEPASSTRLSQDDIKAETREFGREMDTFKAEISGLSHRLDTLIAAVLAVTAANGTNAKPSYTAPYRDPAENWPYHGLDMARDHREWASILIDFRSMSERITRLEREVQMLTLQRQHR